MKSNILKTFFICATCILTGACTDEIEMIAPSTSSLLSTATLDNSSSSLYYYYQGEKQYLKVNPTAYYAARVNGHSTDDIITCIKTYTSGVTVFRSQEAEGKLNESTIAPIAQKETFANTQSLQSMSKDNYVAKLHNAANDNDILYVTPCFVSEDNKEFSNSPYIYVKLKEAKDTTLLQEVTQNLSLDICENISYMPLWYKVSCLNKKQKCSLELANEIYETGLFESAEPGFVGTIQTTASHSDPFYNDQWGLENIGQYGGTSGIDIKSNEAHSVSSGFGVTVAVVDCGIDYSHPDLLPYTYAYDAYTNTETSGYSTVYTEYNNEAGKAHGTACAGIIGAQANSIGTCGIAPASFTASISCPISQSDQSVLARGIAWASQKGIGIISCSWGGGTPSDILDSAIKQAVNNGRNGKGCIVCFATGNNDTNSISYPSSLDDVVSVGAIDMFGKRKVKNSKFEYWWGSNYGEGIDVVAPGIRISTTDISGTRGINSGSSMQAEIIDYQDNNYTKVFNGTSAATPFVAGVAALILERKPSLTSKEVRSIIQSTCTKLPAYFPNSANTSKTDGTWNQEVGYGLVNAYNAVAKAIMGDSQYTITGNTVLTNTSWNNFVVSNIPRGTYINWSISDNVNFSISQNGYNSVLVKAKQTGKSAILTATIKTSNGSDMQSISTEISSLY